ncbi:DKNYY domain-containing protein [Pseudomonadota bacterium]
MDNINQEVIESVIQHLLMYSKDNKYVYHLKRKVIGADYKSFKAINSCHAKDKESGYYWEEKIEGSHGPSFEYVGAQGWDTNVDGIWGSYEYAKDKNYVYRDGKRIEKKIHSPSFKLTPGKRTPDSTHDCIAEDKYNIYEHGGLTVIPK